MWSSTNLDKDTKGLVKKVSIPDPPKPDGQASNMTTKKRVDYEFTDIFLYCPFSVDSDFSCHQYFPFRNSGYM
jgi:hypothetical protein